MSSDVLVNRIQQKRDQVESFLSTAVPRKRRLLNTTVIGGALAAVLTAGPAIGGASFTQWLTQALTLASPSWRFLCGAASLCSLTATIATQLLRSYGIEERVTRAQSCRAKLEVLEIGLTTGQIDERQATTEFLRCVEESAFLTG